MHERADVWKEQKRVATELSATRERLAASETRGSELDERLERRDRLIERLSRGHGADADATRRLRHELEAARAREATQLSAETTLRRERALLEERLRIEGAKADGAIQVCGRCEALK